MPDLATHSIVTILVQRATGKKLALLIVVIGTIIPDILSRVPVILFYKLEWLGVPFHAPIPLLVLAYFVSLLFQEQSRPLIFASLISGMGIHLFLDMLQWHIAEENYYWLYPFSRFQYELGLIDTNTLFLFLPFLVLILVMMELFRAFRHRKKLASKKA